MIWFPGCHMDARTRPYCLVVVECNGTIRFANGLFRKIFFGGASCLGQDAAAKGIFHPEDMDIALKGFQECLQKPYWASNTVRSITHSGKTVLYRWTGQGLPGRCGEIEMISIVGEKIVDRRWGERRLGRERRGARERERESKRNAEKLGNVLRFSA